MKIRTLVICVMTMSAASLLSLLILSVLTYVFKWKADVVMIGIIATYIIAGLAGGLALKIKRQENRNISKKMLEAILGSSLFMGVLLLLSMMVVQDAFVFSGRFLMIWMLMVGSCCLGRIL